MKKIVFTKRCYDKNTGERYSVGQTKAFANKRADEIVKTGRAEYQEELDDDTDNSEEEQDNG